jgi:hypothetical protein
MMSVQDAMRPLVKMAAASTVLRSYMQVFAGPPKRILLMPSDTMYDYQRLAPEFPDSEYWAIERNREIAEEIQKSNKFDRVIASELRTADRELEGHTFGLVYFDLQGTASQENIMAVSEALLGRIPSEGALLATTFLQRPTRGARLVDYTSVGMSTARFSQHVRRALIYEMGSSVYMRKISDFGYQSGTGRPKRFVLSTYYVSTCKAVMAMGTPWEPKKRLAAWNVKNLAI